MIFSNVIMRIIVEHAYFFLIFSIFWALWDFSLHAPPKWHKDVDIEMQNLTEKFIAYLGPGIFFQKFPERI